MSLRPSFYNHSFLADDGQTAVWNSVSGALLRLGPGESAALNGFGIGGMTDERARQLHQLGILVDSDVDEARPLIESAGGQNLVRNHFRILTTTSCNAHCDYCYEKGIAESCMNAATAAQTARVIERQFKSQTFVSVPTLEWYGGEPLLNTSVISQICGHLSCASVPFRSLMFTNGLLFTKELIESAKKNWRLEWVQISMDSVGKDYETGKGLNSGSFRLLLDNLKRLLESGIKVSLRVNFDGDTDAALAVIACLHQHFQRSKNLLHVYISPLYASVPEAPEKTMRQILGISDNLVESGLVRSDAVYHLQRRSGRCFMTKAGGRTVAPDGNLYNCSHAMTTDQCVGTVWDIRDDLPARKAFAQSALSSKCASCRLLPVCLGGCRAAELGLATTYQCLLYKSVLDDVLRKRLEMEIQHCSHS